MLTRLLKVAAGAAMVQALAVAPGSSQTPDPPETKPAVRVPVDIVPVGQLHVREVEPKGHYVETQYRCPSPVGVRFDTGDARGWTLNGSPSVSVVGTAIQSGTGSNFLVCYYGNAIQDDAWDGVSAIIEADRAEPFCRELPDRGAGTFGCRPEMDWLNKVGRTTLSESTRLNLDEEAHPQASTRPDIGWGTQGDALQLLALRGGGGMGVLSHGAPSRGACSAATDDPVLSIDARSLRRGMVVCYMTDKQRPGYLRILEIAGSTVSIEYKTYAWLE